MEINSIQSVVSTNTFKDFHTPDKIKAFENQNSSAPVSLQDEHHHNHKKSIIKEAVPLFGAILGTVLPLIIFNKVQGKKLNTETLKTGKFIDKLKEICEFFEIDNVPKILSTAGGAILGGIAGGCVVDKNKNDRKEKIKEGVFEMTNIAVPTLFAAGIMKFMQSKDLHKGIGKFVPVVLGLGAGIPIAQKLSNTISKTVFKEDGEERKFKPSDLLVHSDDLIEMLVLLKIPFARKLQIDKILALIYAKCGYEAGVKNSENKASGHHHH